MRTRPPHSHPRLICRFCGQEHGSVQLGPGEKALCVRCDSFLAQGARLSPDTGLVFALTGLILTVPAAVLPFISAGKLGEERVSHLFTGVSSLWGDHMRALALLVLFCGGILPMLQLATLTVLHAAHRLGWEKNSLRALHPTARFLEHWSIPEVQVLAIIVALVKLGSLVDVRLQLGFWCYCAMSFCLVVTQQSFDFEAIQPPLIPEATAVRDGATVSP